MTRRWAALLVGAALLAGCGDDPAEALQLAREFESEAGFEVLEASSFSDQNALAVLPAVAARHGLREIGDLAKVPGGATIAAPPEFRTRVEGMVGLRDVYGLDAIRLRALPIGAQYGALEGRQVDAAAVFTTDGQLAERDYRVLEDPRVLFAQQHVAPIVSEALVEEHGEQLTAVIDGVTQRLTVEAMRRMNAEVDLRGGSPAAVAERFLGLD